MRWEFGTITVRTSDTAPVMSQSIELICCHALLLSKTCTLDTQVADHDTPIRSKPHPVPVQAISSKTDSRYPFGNRNWTSIASSPAAFRPLRWTTGGNLPWQERILLLASYRPVLHRTLSSERVRSQQMRAAHGWPGRP